MGSDHVVKNKVGEEEPIEEGGEVNLKEERAD
jgi:hypothetical protein